MVVSTLTDANGNLINLAHAIPASDLARFLCSNMSCSAEWQSLSPQDRRPLQQYLSAKGRQGFFRLIRTVTMVSIVASPRPATAASGSFRLSTGKVTSTDPSFARSWRVASSAALMKPSHNSSEGARSRSLVKASFSRP